MAKKPEKPKLSPMSQTINDQLNNCPPSPISVHKDILTRKLTPAEEQEQAKQEELANKSRLTLD